MSRLSLGSGNMHNKFEVHSFNRAIIQHVVINIHLMPLHTDTQTQTHISNRHTSNENSISVIHSVHLAEIIKVDKLLMVKHTIWPTFGPRQTTGKWHKQVVDCVRYQHVVINWDENTDKEHCVADSYSTDVRHISSATAAGKLGRMPSQWQESLADAKVSMREQCVYEGP